MSKYTLREVAKEDPKEIGRYTKKHWGIEQRNKYLHQFNKRFAWLAKNSRYGRTREEIKQGYYSYDEGSHVIFYTIGNNSIEILGIIHKKMIRGCQVFSVNENLKSSISMGLFPQK